MAAIRYLKEIGFDTIERREAELTQYAVKRLLAIPGVHILGSQDPSEHHSIVTFLVDNRAGPERRAASALTGRG